MQSAPLRESSAAERVSSYRKPDPSD